MYVRKAKAQPETGSTPQQVSPEVPAPPAAAAPTVTPSEAPPPQQQGADNQEAERKARAEEAARKAREQQLDALEREADQLSGRAEAVNSSLDRLQQQQNAAGYGLRGDMAARQSNMKANLAKAQDAVGRGDIDRAKRYLELAQSDAEALERFLGH
jgi:hypothetical protein